MLRDHQQVHFIPRLSKLSVLFLSVNRFSNKVHSILSFQALQRKIDGGNVNRLYCTRPTNVVIQAYSSGTSFKLRRQGTKQRQSNVDTPDKD